MAVHPTNHRPLATQSAEKIFNAVRGTMSPQFQVRIPAATQGNIRQSIEQISQYPVLRDEFYNTFIQRIIGMYIQHADYDNPLRDMGTPNELKRYGGTYEQAAVGLIEARTRDYNKEYLGDDVFGRYQVPVKNYFHPLNFNHYYPVTVPQDAILTAFTSDGNMGDFIAELMDAPIKSDRNDMYLMMTQCFAEYAKQGGYFRIHTDDVGAWDSTEAQAKNMLRQIRAMSDTLRATPLSGMGRYNAAHWVIPWNRENAVLFATPQVISALDVNALAQTFNIDKADINYRIIPINPEQFGIRGAQAILTTTDFWFRWDQILETTNSPINPIDNSYNIFYKHSGSITPNPLANALLFWTGEGTPENINLPSNVTANTPEFTVELRKYGEENIIPENVRRGGIVQVWSNITVEGDPDFTPLGVEYVLEGATSQYTRLDNEGILVCGLDESATTLRVKARATYIDPAHPEVTQETSAALDVPVVGDYLGGWSPSIFKSLEISPSGDAEIELKSQNGAKVGTATFRAIGTTMSGEKIDVSHLSKLNVTTVTGDARDVSVDGMTVTVSVHGTWSGSGDTYVRAEGIGMTSGDSFAVLKEKTA